MIKWIENLPINPGTGRFSHHPDTFAPFGIDEKTEEISPIGFGPDAEMLQRVRERRRIVQISQISRDQQLLRA